MHGFYLEVISKQMKQWVNVHCDNVKKKLVWTEKNVKSIIKWNWWFIRTHTLKIKRSKKEEWSFIWQGNVMNLNQPSKNRKFQNGNGKILKIRRTRQYFKASKDMEKDSWNIFNSLDPFLFDITFIINTNELSHNQTASSVLDSDITGLVIITFYGWNVVGSTVTGSVVVGWTATGAVVVGWTVVGWTAIGAVVVGWTVTGWTVVG